MATAGQPIDDAASQASEPNQSVLPASVLALVDPPEPSPLQKRCYWAKSAGQSVAEIAKKFSISEQEVTDAILAVQTDNERYSAARAGVEARKLFFQMLPKMGLALDEALSATKLHGKKVVMIDKESGEEVTVEDYVERPDHDTRLRAIDTSRYILSVVQPKDPAIQITTNSQTNILNQAAQPGQLGAGGPTSPEAVIRNIVQQRQNALPASTTIEAKAKVIEARVEVGSDPDEDDLLADESEEDEDSSSDDDEEIESSDEDE